MKYNLKTTTVFPDGCVVNVHSPQLSEEERDKTFENLKRAAQLFAKSIVNKKTTISEKKIDEAG